MSGDIFELRTASPMLIKDEGEPFDSPDYVFELKLDGIRSLAYLDSGFVELRNKRNKILNATYPELAGISSRINRRCILDGELVILTDEKPDFNALQKRSLLTDKFRIQLLAKQKPVRFVAYDVLYESNRQITELPLLERKDILNSIVDENEALSISRVIPERGIDFFKLTSEQKLEGIVGKQKNSLYYMGRETNKWIKIKLLHDDDFIICGYELNEKGKISSIVLGAYGDGHLVYQGHVSGISYDISGAILSHASAEPFPCPIPDYRDPEVLWLKPELCCVVTYMTRTESGFLRQPSFKGLALDKDPNDCVVKKS
jgi:bifunctional non-homologous end joining protein LigD